ncbi:putative reverse transcriptase domain-containing protein [Tanacetum coccineum]
MCPELVPTEKKKIERYTRRFPERIKGNITSSKPATLHDAINMARELVEQAVQGKATRIGESNKRKWEDHQRNTNNNNNNPNNNNNRNRNNNYHQQQNKRQETARAYAAALTENRGYAGNLPKAILPGACNDFLQNATCYGCGEKGHLKNKCPKAGNQHNEGARARAYVVVENPQQNPNVVTALTTFIDISPTALNTSYEVELADGKVLSYHRTVIDCYEKIVRIPLPNGEIFEVQGERPEKDHGSLTCIKADEKKLDDIVLSPKTIHEGIKKLTNKKNPLPLPEYETYLINYKVVLFSNIELRLGYHHHAIWADERTSNLYGLNEPRLPTDFDKIHPSKVESVKNWKTPESSTEIRSFSGLIGYHQRFIENSQDPPSPSPVEHQNNKTKCVGHEQDEVFRILKEKLCNAPVLALPDGPDDFVVYCDASK